MPKVTQVTFLNRGDLFFLTIKLLSRNVCVYVVKYT